MDVRTVTMIAQENEGLAKQAQEAKMFENLGRALVRRNEDNQKYQAGVEKGKREAESMFVRFMNRWKNSLRQPTINEGLAAEMKHAEELYNIEQANRLIQGR